MISNGQWSISKHFLKLFVDMGKEAPQKNLQLDT
jgi:hypothetical protein